MALFCKLFLTFVFSMVLSSSSLAGNYVELGSQSKKLEFETLGKAPVKKNKVLKLGKLRMTEARLPTEGLSLSGRMKLRAQQAVKRQNAVSRAKRRASDVGQSYEEPESEASNSGVISAPVKME